MTDEPTPKFMYGLYKEQLELFKAYLALELMRQMYPEYERKRLEERGPHLEPRPEDEPPEEALEDGLLNAVLSYPLQSTDHALLILGADGITFDVYPLRLPPLRAIRFLRVHRPRLIQMLQDASLLLITWNDGEPSATVHGGEIVVLPLPEAI